jgi:hypothetical protein
MSISLRKLGVQNPSVLKKLKFSNLSNPAISKGHIIVKLTLVSALSLSLSLIHGCNKGQQRARNRKVQDGYSYTITVVLAMERGSSDLNRTSW